MWQQTGSPINRAYCIQLSGAVNVRKLIRSTKDGLLNIGRGLIVFVASYLAGASSLVAGAELLKLVIGVMRRSVRARLNSGTSFSSKV